MFGFIKDIKAIYSKSQYHPTEQKTTALYDAIDANIEHLRVSFSNSADLTIRRIKLSGLKAAVVSIDNMIDKQVLAEGVLMPLMSDRFIGEAGRLPAHLEQSVLYTADCSELESFEKLEFSIMSGCAVLLIDGVSTAVSIGLQGYASRSVSEPDSDVVQRGSKEGFVEALRVNMTLIRRRLKNPKLCFETMVIGKKGKTEISLCYLTDAVSPEILTELKKRLKRTDLSTVLASGYLVPYLEKKGDFSFFSGVGITERPDTVCGKLTEGRIAILVDGVPSALIVPYLLAEYFQTLDDYSNRAYFATFTRLLKYISFLISILLPGLFTALGTFDPEVFPSLLLNKIASSIAATPLSLPAETILILFVYEIMREAGLRMPQPLGYAVSIVGGLVVGDTAVNAGLIGAPTLMVVAVTAISSYVIPDLYAPSCILRFIFTITGGIFGIWGIAAVLSITLINLCGKTSFGVPFTSPLTPFSAYSFRDVIVRAGWKVLSKNEKKVQELPGADKEGSDLDE